jgi:hypothetical protein
MAWDLADFSFDFSDFIQRDTIIEMKIAIAIAPPIAPLI